MVKKAITHLRLDQANASKLQQLDELAAEHPRVVQAYVDWLIAHAIRRPDKYADIPEPDVPTPLSDPLATLRLAPSVPNCPVMVRQRARKPSHPPQPLHSGQRECRGD